MASSGPNLPGTASQQTGTYGGYNGNNPWDTPNLIKANDSAYATCPPQFIGCDDEYLFSWQLRGTNYGFAIPSGATIDGIEVTIARYVDFSLGCGEYPYDVVVQLIKGGTIVGTNKADMAPWGDSPYTTTYGGATDLWGTTWTQSDINSSGFGIALEAYTGYDGATPAVDYITIKVYYTASGSGGSGGSSGTGINSKFFFMFD